MNPTFFGLGDKVTFKPTGAECVIVGSKEIPVDSIILGKVYPEYDKDFVLQEITQIEAKFHPFIHASKDELRHQASPS